MPIGTQTDTVGAVPVGTLSGLREPAQSLPQTSVSEVALWVWFRLVDQLTEPG